MGWFQGKKATGNAGHGNSNRSATDGKPAAADVAGAEGAGVLASKAGGGADDGSGGTTAAAAATAADGGPVV